MKLPEMPEPRWVMPEHMAGRWKVPGAWDADQMRSFFELGYKMGREDAARVVDGYIPTVVADSESDKESAEVMTALLRMYLEPVSAAIRKGEQG